MATFVCADCIFGGTTVRQVTSVSHRGGNTVRKGMISGGAGVSQVSGLLGEEITTVTAHDLATLLAIGTNTFLSAGLYVSSGTVTVPFKSRATGGQFASGSNHSALSGTDALIIPTTVEATQDSDPGASCTMEVHWISADGETKGATGSTGNALGSQAFGTEFSLGPVYVNGSQIDGIQSVRISPGITVVKSRADGLPLPVKVSIQTIAPTIEFTSNDIDAVVALASTWTSMSSANIYLRKRNDAGVFVAGATTEHARITFAAGLIVSDDIAATDNNNGTSTVTLHGKTLTSSVAVALP